MRTAYIGMGANLPGPAGPPDATLAAAARRLGALGHVAARSRLYSTAPVGFAGQPRFLNAALALETELEPRALLDGLLAIEREFGRDRRDGIVNGPRTLDLDILLFDELIVSEANLEIPHPRLKERAFALVPLAEIAPAARDPRTGATMAQWLERVFPNPAREASNPAAGATDAVLPFQSDLWNAGGDFAGSPDAGIDRANPGHADRSG